MANANERSPYTFRINFVIEAESDHEAYERAKHLELKLLGLKPFYGLAEEFTAVHLCTKPFVDGSVDLLDISQLKTNKTKTKRS